MEQPPHPLQSLERDLDALRAAWADAMPAFGALPGGAQVELEQMSDCRLRRGGRPHRPHAPRCRCAAGEGRQRDRPAVGARVRRHRARQAAGLPQRRASSRRDDRWVAQRGVSAHRGGCRHRRAAVVHRRASSGRRIRTWRLRLPLPRSAPRPRRRSPRCSTVWVFAPIQRSPRSPKPRWSTWRSSRRSNSWCAACARQRPDSTKTASNREKTCSGVSDR